MLKQLIDLMREGFQEFSILSEHENGYCYELINVSLPMERDDIVAQMKQILTDFNAQHKRIAINYIDKDNELYQRMVQVQLRGCTHEAQKEFYERLFMNIHKSKSPIKKLIVSQIELFHIEEGVKFS